jgi:hypothetical protein
MIRSTSEAATDSMLGHKPIGQRSVNDADLIASAGFQFVAWANPNPQGHGGSFDDGQHGFVQAIR